MLELKDVAIVALIFAIVLNWSTVEKEVSIPDPLYTKHRKTLRKNGIDYVRMESIKEELIRRGVPAGNIPNFRVDGKGAAEIGATYETLLDRVPYVKSTFDKAFTDKTPAFSSAQEPWPRAPEKDDV